jgi:hypothetical protein
MDDGDRQPAPPSRALTVVRAIGYVVLFAAGLVLRILSIQADDRDGGSLPATTRDPGVHVRTVAPGTCLAEVYPQDYVHPVPCTVPHPTEIVALPTYPGPPGGEMPPVLDVFRQAFATCESAFKAFVGGTPDQTPARFGAITPRLHEWRGGERIVVCYAEGRNGVPLTASLRDGATRAPPR